MVNGSVLSHRAFPGQITFTPWLPNTVHTLITSHQGQFGLQYLSQANLNMKFEIKPPSASPLTLKTTVPKGLPPLTKMWKPGPCSVSYPPNFKAPLLKWKTQNMETWWGCCPDVEVCLWLPPCCKHRHMLQIRKQTCRRRLLLGHLHVLVPTPGVLDIACGLQTRGSSLETCLSPLHLPQTGPRGLSQFY